ncbi:MAG: 16S rRNA (adenine(1518)-N(6)/adenine(1519)-N(6))-dimethyltransferase RsmA [Deltaproteobacteria bacterium]
MSSRRELVDRLEHHELFAKKALGQNFLVDPSALDAIADAVGEAPLVVEIGPGPGTLTERLLARAERVVAIEKDRRFVPVLEGLAGADALEVVNADFLATPLAPIVGDVRAPVVGNIPYNITTPILLSLLTQRAVTGHAVIMMQREVADRLVARVGTKRYGSLTVLFSVHAEIRTVRNVPAGCFVPRPRVDSTVLRFDWRDAPAVDIGDPTHFEAVVRAAFGQRRKTLRNALSARFDREVVLRGGDVVDLSRRAETLDLETFAALASALA